MHVARRGARGRLKSPDTCIVLAIPPAVVWARQLLPMGLDLSVRGF